MRDKGPVLQEENEWLKSALRMAESTIMQQKRDLTSCREAFTHHKVDTESRLRSMEGDNRKRDDERREAEHALLAAEEYRRGLEARLREAQRRSEWVKETEHQIMENERARVDYIAEVTRRSDQEKRELEGELMRLQDDLRAEKGARAEAEQREASLRSDFNRLAEHRQADGAAGRQSYPDTRSSYDTNIGDSFATAQLGHYSMAPSQAERVVQRVPAAAPQSSELMLA